MKPLPRSRARLQLTTSQPTLVPRTREILAEVVLPRLEKVVGPKLVLPPSIELVDAPNVTQGQGFVHIDCEPSTWRIMRVLPPVIAAAHDDEVLAWILAHELCHYHELIWRHRQSIVIADRAASGLWSEYYAVRTSARAGFVKPPAIAAPAGDREPAGQATSDAKGEASYSGATSEDYYVTWMLAWVDAAVPGISALGAGAHQRATALNTLEWAPRKYYNHFPSWERSVPEKLVRFFTVVRMLREQGAAGENVPL